MSLFTRCKSRKLKIICYGEWIILFTFTWLHKFLIPDSGYQDTWNYFHPIHMSFFVYLIHIFFLSKYINVIKVWISLEVIYYGCTFMSWTSQSSLFGGFAVLHPPKSDEEMFNSQKCIHDKWLIKIFTLNVWFMSFGQCRMSN